MTEIPKDGYWHIRINFSKESLFYDALDMSYEELMNIVQKYNSNQSFTIDGRIVKQNTDLDYIRICHTERKHTIYGKGSNVYYDQWYVFEPDDCHDTEDFTNELLNPIQENIEKDGRTSNGITINNINQQQQMQSQSQQITMNQIIEIQDTFAELRKELKSNGKIDCEEMKEIQDALDELSQNSTTEQKNKAFTKLRRFINTVSSIIDKTSKAFELFKELKKIYNYIAPIIGLMSI